MDGYLTKQVEDRLKEIVNTYIHAEETCESVIKYFDDKRHPKGPYVALAKYFLGETELHSDADYNYKSWLKNLIDSGQESKSIVLNSLKEKYESQGALERFVFFLNDMSIQENQKWHFFISYLGYKEFVTRFPEKNSEKISPLSKNFSIRKIKCEELKIWMDYAETIS